MGALPKSQDQALDALRSLEEDILLGRLYPRERLVEEQLAERFGIKRHVVRQVLQDLETAGLVVREAGKGAIVREYSSEEVGQLYQMREIVEGEAARRIALPVAPEIFDALKSLCDDYAESVRQSDMRGVIAANKKLHEELYQLCGNAFLADTINAMAQKANLVRFSTSTDPAYLARASEEHYGILEALRGTDNERLAALCIDHIQPSRRLYLEKRARLK